MEKTGQTKYAVLVDTIRDDILTGRIRAGEKIASENELADMYKISRHTVRKALSILEQDGYVNAIHGVGTFCTQKSRQRGQSKNIAVVTTYITDYIFPRVIQGIDNVLADKGYSIMLKSTGNSRAREREILTDLLTKDIDGLIVEPSKSQILCKNMDLYAKLDELRIPYVFIQGSYLQMQDKPHVIMNDEKGGYLLTDYLIKTGHQSIVGIFKADDSQGKERHKGYVRALMENGRIYDPDMVIWYHTEDRTQKPAKMVEFMLSNKVRMDAIVCYNDQIAMEVYQMLLRNNVRVPDDISITGYDNSYHTENSIIQLTTIAHPQEKLGEMAAELILEQIDRVPKEESKVPQVIEPVLIIGNSVSV